MKAKSRLGIDPEPGAADAPPVGRAVRVRLAGGRRVHHHLRTQAPAGAGAHGLERVGRQVVGAPHLDGARRQDARAAELAAAEQHLAEARVVGRGREQAVAAERRHRRLASDRRASRRAASACPTRPRRGPAPAATASPSARRSRCRSSSAARTAACAGSRRTTGPTASRPGSPARRPRRCTTSGCPAAPPAAARRCRSISDCSGWRGLSTSGLEVQLVHRVAADQSVGQPGRVRHQLAHRHRAARRPRSWACRRGSRPPTP